MRDVLDDLLTWWEAGEPVGMGTVVATFRSAPRPPGASMLVGPDGRAVGSVSGGCVEGAVYELATSVAVAGRPVLQRYGISDDDAFEVGLTCGGILDVYVERVDRETFPELGEVAADIRAGRPVAVATVIEHPDPDRVGRRLVLRPEHPHRNRAGTLVGHLDPRGHAPRLRIDQVLLQTRAQGGIGEGGLHRGDVVDEREPLGQPGVDRHRRLLPGPVWHRAPGIRGRRRRCGG